MKESGQLIDILLVEDNPCDVELTRHFFDTAKVRNNLHVVSSGEEALDFIYHRGSFQNSVDPDLVLLDMNLPQIDGYELIDILRDEPTTHNLPIIVLTGSDAERDLAGAHAHHANFYITKPLTFLTFINAVQSLEDFWFGLVNLTHDHPNTPTVKKAS